MVLYLAFAALLRLDPEASSVPLKQPQLAVQGNTVAVTYGAGSSIYAAVSTDAGKTFGKPVKVADAKFVALGMHRGPRIAITPDFIVVSAITGVTRGQDGDLIAWRSTDRGKTWSSGAKVNEVANSAREGLHGMASNEMGLLFAVWLDLRTKGTKLYGSVSTDGGTKWSKNLLVFQSPDGSICECCHPTAFVSRTGDLFAMWRNAMEGSRDMFLAFSTDNGASFLARKLGDGTWPLKACPMDGGGLAIDAKGSPHTAWRRESTVYYAQGDKTESEVGKGKNPALAVGANGPYIAWSEGTALKLKAPGTAESRVLAPEGAFVSLAGSGPIYAAWEEKGGIAIERVD